MFAVEIWEHWPSGSRQPGQLALLALRSVTRSTTPDTRRRPRRGQVRARAIVTDQTTLSIKVSNDSERHISSISFMYVEDSLAGSLLRKRQFVIPERRTARSLLT